LADAIILRPLHPRLAILLACLDYGIFFKMVYSPRCSEHL
jgi:hypothetical protein